MDLNSDGIPDILSGSYHGGIFLFKGLGENSFAQGEKLIDYDYRHKDLKRMRGVTVACMDNDGDGDLDMIVGTMEELLLLENTGDSKRYRFEKPQALLHADGAEVKKPGTKLGVCIADWDLDGRQDLLVSATVNGIFFYRNIGSDSKPAWAKPVLIHKTPAQVEDRAKVTVADWNGDGLPDLIYGSNHFSDGRVYLCLRTLEKPDARNEK